MTKAHSHLRQGITSQHLSFISNSNFIVLCYVTEPGEEIPLNIADITFAVIEHRPCIIIVCCNPVDSKQYIPFPTVVQTNGYSAEALQATAELLLGQNTQPMPASSTTLTQRQPVVWKVDGYNESRDIAEVHDLWKTCISSRLLVDQHTLGQLLDRSGYAKHYIVRDTQNGRILGFCATYFNYVDRAGEDLVASIACVITHPAHRRQGIGLSLHTYAIAQLRKIRGVIRLQLGSAYPRLLHGPLFELSAEEHMAWIRRRGWLISDLLARDLLLECNDWPSSSALPQAGDAVFRACRPHEMIEVIDLVDKTALRLGKTGWYDQYMTVMDTSYVKDVIIGVEGETIMATALTFTPGCGSQISQNIPWPAQIGSDVGAIACICVSGKSNGRFLSHVYEHTSTDVCFFWLLSHLPAAYFELRIAWFMACILIRCLDC